MKKDETELKYFEVLAELLLQSIRGQETNYSITLSSFFYTAFKKVRDKFIDEPVVYPELYYEIVNKAIEELAIINEKRNYALEHRTSGGIWLLGETQNNEISEYTYYWLWRNLLVSLNYQKDDMIMNHWKTCHQYYSYNIPLIYEEYESHENSFQVGNSDQVLKRTYQRKRFIEFHYALGGVLLYSERYSCINRIFNYTQSQPPKYDLLPESMDTIFNFYFELRDIYDIKYSWISRQYPFPQLEGIKADSLIKKWIMSYMAILFLRQYSIYPYLVTMRPLEYPIVPKMNVEIKQWIDGLDFFKNLVREHLENYQLLKSLNFDFITTDWCQTNNKVYPLEFFDNLKTELEVQYQVNSINLPISATKVHNFEVTSKNKIEKLFEDLLVINNKGNIESSESDRWFVNGLQIMQSKDAFTENSEVHYIDLDSFLARSLITKLREGLCESFIRKTSVTYLLKNEDLFKAIDLLGIDESYIIVNFGLNLNTLVNQFYDPSHSISKYKNIDIYSFDGTRIVNDSLFILKKTDLPNITTRQIENDVISKYELKKISNVINLYASVIDLNKTNEGVYNEMIINKTDEEVRKSVLLNLTLSAEFKWKQHVNLIQIRQYSDYFQKGILNKLEDIVLL